MLDIEDTLLQFIIIFRLILCTINLHPRIDRSIFPNLNTPTDTIGYLLNVERVCSRCSSATGFFLDAAGA